MGFAFSETMTGWLALAGDAPQPSGAAGAETPPPVEERRPFHFRVKATAPSLRRHLLDGNASLEGVVHAPPLCEAADATGTMLIRPLGARIIRYRLTFQDDTGRRLTFLGQKDLRYLAPLRTFTELDGELRADDGELVARAHVCFDLRRDWLTFARSFHWTR